MSRITPLMTSLHEGHKTEERLKCIDDMLVKCDDTKFNVLQAFWWYRKYTKAKLQKLEKIEQIVEAYITDNPREPMYDTEDYMNSIREVLEQDN